MSKIQIAVEIDEKDGKFFADLMTGGLAWATSAKLSLSGVDAALGPIDASWLLRANVSLLE